MFVRPNIAGMQPYIPGEQPSGSGFVKLNTNENPYPPSPRVVRALLAEAWGALNLYPDPMADAVRDRLAKRFGLKRENFLIGNGGDDILTIVTRCLVDEHDRVACPVPTYILYRTMADLQGGEIIEVPFGEDFSLPEGLFGNEARVTFLANPNSPSGTAASVSEVKRLAESLDGVLVVDEAYADFAEENCMDLVGTLANLCVLRSFSKSFSLAGLRIGYLAGPADFVAECLKAKDSYNVNRLSIVAAATALDDYDYMLSNVEQIRQTRRFLADSLDALGFKTLPSQANFVWTRAPAPGAKAIYEDLKGRKILVRFWDSPLMNEFLRISVGKRDEIDLLLGVLGKITEAAGDD
ncbi:MAG: histidinol-phosphate transaminase [Planctomycetes bacterium]|nr:histidinol-phosphate transaminase [Planctomycetota bacterium]